MPDILTLQAKMGQVAIAYRDAGAGRKQAVDHGHQAAENPRGRREAGGGTFGHFGPLFCGSDALRGDGANLGI